jgi:phenylalanyl-tRNA synthetase beta chain
MLVSLNWLRKFVKLDIPVDELVELIGARLVEVEGVIDERKKYDNIYVVKVVSAERVPETKLSLCKIDDAKASGVERDEDGLVQVMCGAPNVHAGMLAVWIAPGAVVPASAKEDAPFVIGTRKMLGKFQSYGMLAGADELDFGNEHKSIAELSPEIAKIGMPFAEVFGLDDMILEIENKSLTHRPDCFGMVGFAREVAGILGQDFETPEWLLELGERDFVVDGVNLKVKVDAKLCPRYTALVMEWRGEGKKEYLNEMQTLISRCGMRPISPLVDVTNYLMLLTGQPLHAFDYDKLVAVGGKDKPEIIVRAGRKGDKLELIDGRTIEAGENDILITSSDVPVALAGAMGGKNTEVDEGTKRIVVESATFSLYNLRKTQMAHGIFSEAITRFTKGQPAGQTLPVVKEFARMVSGDMKSVGLVDEYPKPAKPSVVKITTGHVNELLGTNYDIDTIRATLMNVGFGVAVAEGGVDALLHVTAPYWRTDIHIAEDVIEEVGRLLGYDNIVPTLPLHGTATLNAQFQLKTQVRQILASAGASEALTYSFVHEDLLRKAGQDPKNSYKIVNSISPDLQYFRQSLTPSLLDKVYSNVDSGYSDFALFEMNQVYQKSYGFNDEKVPAGKQQLAFVIATPTYGSPYYVAKKYLEELFLALNVDFSVAPVVGKDASSLPFEIKRSAQIKTKDGKVCFGILGEYKPSVIHSFGLPAHLAGFELDLEEIQRFAGVISEFGRTSRYPFAKRDITLIVAEGTPYEEIVGDIRSRLEKAGLIFVIAPVSIYQGDDKSVKSVTFHLEFADTQKTLTNEEIGDIMKQLEKIGSGR